VSSYLKVFATSGVVASIVVVDVTAPSESVAVRVSELVCVGAGVWLGPFLSTVNSFVLESYVPQ
jgi:hypothetical protein